MKVRKRYTENQEVTRVTVTLQVVAAILTAAILTAVLSCPPSQDEGDVQAAEQEGPAGREAEAGGVAGVEEEAEVESVGEAELESVGGDDQHHSIMTGQQLQQVRHYCGSTYNYPYHAILLHYLQMMTLHQPTFRLSLHLVSMFRHPAKHPISIFLFFLTTDSGNFLLTGRTSMR